MNTVDYKEQSPCLECPNHLNGIDKRLCLGKCLRLKTYQARKDWTKEETYIVDEGKDLVEDIENSEWDTGSNGTVDVDHVDSEFYEPANGSEETDPEELPGPVKRIQPETSWKKTINPKTTKGGRKKCAICGKPEGQDNKFLRGVCRKPCYNQWYFNRVEHPLLGKFKATTKEVLSMESEKSSTKKSLGKATPEMNSSPMTTIDDICLTTININLELYPQIMKLIYRMAVDLSLPVTHIVVTLLAEALANRSKQ